MGPLRLWGPLGVLVAACVLVQAIQLKTDVDTLFTALDTNFNGVLEEHEVANAMFSDLQPSKFASLLEEADLNHDGALSLPELQHGLHQQHKALKHHVVEAQATKDPSPEFIVEAESTSDDTADASTSGNSALLEDKAEVHVDDSSREKAKESADAAAFQEKDDQCMMCIYIAERSARNLQMAGVLNSFQARPMRSGWHRKGEFPAMSFVEQESTASQYPMGYTDSGMSGTTPAYDALHGGQMGATTAGAYGYGMAGAGAPRTPQGSYMDLEAGQPLSNPVNGPGDMVAGPENRLYWQNVEFQLYNQIKHNLDMSLDDICESSMPNSLYKYCRIFLTREKAVANLMGRQFKPQDICISIGMCSKSSYLFRLYKHTSAQPSAKNNAVHPLYSIGVASKKKKKKNLLGKRWRQ